MKKNLHLLIYCLAALFTVATTGCNNETPSTAEPHMANVKLKLSPTPLEQPSHESSSRAGQPMFPDDENPIYDIWILQFDPEGIIIGSPQYHKCDENGDLSHMLTPKELDVLLRTGQSTVCAVGNIGADFKFEIDGRPIDNLSSFRDMLIDAPLLKDDDSKIGHLEKHSMYLYGFFQGTIDEKNLSEPLNILLGRLFMRINLEITNSTGQDLKNIEVKITNVPSVTHIPFVDIPLEKDFLKESFKETIKEIKAGEVSGQYYYMPENISPTKENATEITITTADGKSASVKLGNDSPETEAAERDYSLNRNNIYTFKLNLK